MKKSQALLLSAIVLSTPFLILGVINATRIEPEEHVPISEQNLAAINSNEANIVTVEADSNVTESFMNGYKDGWRGKLIGPLRWTFNEDYRQGHMLGVHDRKNGIARYEK